MRTIILTYPGFQSLPRGIKQMLVTSEEIFFGNARAITSNKKNAGQNDAKFAQPNAVGFPFAFHRKTASFQP
jgi:hypothetical protein